MDFLYDKVLGCLAGSNIGSAMGAAVEGWEPERIEKEYGILKALLPYAHYGNYGKPGSGRMRPPGTTEDGIERQRLMCTAIIEKGGRITAADLAKVWARDINPDWFGVQMEPCDEILYKAAMSGIPPKEVGRYTNFTGINSFGRSCHPIGLINACNPSQAVLDCYEVGQLYQPLHGYGLDYAAAVCAAIAEAMKPNATVQSVVDVAMDVLPEGDPNQKPRRELQWALDLADKSKDVWDLRNRFYERYTGRGTPYAMSWAQEVIIKGFAIFYKVNGNCYDAIIAGVNFGRDTDCVAAVAAGIAGAFEGTRNIPQEWIETVDAATLQNDYTVSKRLLGETASGLVAAILNEVARAREVINSIEELRSGALTA